MADSSALSSGRCSCRITCRQSCGLPGKRDFRLLLSEQIGAGEIDDLVSPSVQDRLDHVEVKIDDLVQFEAWGHSQFLPVHGNIHQSGTVVREGLFESGPNLLRVINV